MLIKDDIAFKEYLVGGKKRGYIARMKTQKGRIKIRFGHMSLLSSKGKPYQVTDESGSVYSASADMIYDMKPLNTEAWEITL